MIGVQNDEVTKQTIPFRTWKSASDTNVILVTTFHVVLNATILLVNTSRDAIGYENDRQHAQNTT